MKAVVTIVQCRRAVLPHIFVRYVLPEMQRLFPGELECVIIQHRADASGGAAKLESLSQSKDGLQIVREWTEQGRYDGAEIIEHTIIHKPYPYIPSLHLAVKAAVERRADFHLWLEDDALVFDRDCGFWDQLLKGTEVGVYGPSNHLHSAFLLTRPSFDQRMLPKLADYAAWHWKRRRIEPELGKNMRTRRTFLKPYHAVRYHHRYASYAGLRYVVDAVRGLAPEAVPLLDVDFGPGCADLPPISHEERMAHRKEDAKNWVDYFWRARQKVWERWVLPDHL